MEAELPVEVSAPDLELVPDPPTALSDRDLLASSLLFDEVWYRATQAPELAADADAIEHYLGQGATRGRNPHPLFDASWYLDQSTWVEAFGTNPLLHFLRNGVEERRPTRNVGAADTDQGATIAVNLSGPEAVFAKPIAVVVHAYYADLFEGICAGLLYVPRPFILLVSVPSEEARSCIEEVVHRSGLAPARFECRVTPNRGRNFAPFVAEFARDILLCSLVLHLHTKRSLYTGTDQAAWRSALYGGLIGSPWLVGAILRLFAADPELGLFYPALSDTMPYWAHHWLRNAHQGAALMRRLGLGETHCHGYVDYPVGGMFWARVDALAPLLEAGLHYADFPEEQGQTDATLAHAIERVIGVVPKVLGYGFVEYHHRSGTFRHGWSARNLDQYSHTSLDGFAAMAAEARLISFDIFDTLLTRPALSPDSVMRLTGHRLALRDPDLADFFERRKAAEQAARRQRDHEGDVDLDEIYQAFTPDDIWTQPRIEEAKALERSGDRAVLGVRPGAADMLRIARSCGAGGCGARIIAISDTYYTQADVAGFLESAGLAGLLDAIYLSSAERARKDRGDLWTHVAKLEQTAPALWLHVGDNEQSDIQSACDLGMRFFHVMNPALLMEVEGFRRPGCSSQKRWAADLVIGPAMLRIAGSPFRSGAPLRQAKLQDAHEVGYAIFGPIVFMFIAWLVRHPALALVGHLYFLSREGYLLHRIYTAVRARCPDMGLPEGTYFYASRRSSLSAAQSLEFRPDLIIAGAGFTGTLQDLLRSRIGLELPSDFDAAGWAIRLPQDATEVLAALHVLEPMITEHAKAEAAGLSAYARACGMVPGSLAGLIDIGYAATIQKSLQTLLGMPAVGFYMGAYDTAHDVEKLRGFAFGCLAEGIPPWTSSSPALKNSLLMEAFLTAPHGQLLSFATGEAGLPIFKPATMDAAQAQTLERMHDGAFDYARDLLDLYGPDLLLADIELMMPQEFLRMMVDRTIRLPDDVANWFRVEDDYCGNGEIVVTV